MQVYYLTSKKDNMIPMYIGITRQSLSSRLYGHKYHAIKKSNYNPKDNWIRSRGVNNIIIKHLDTASSIEDLSTKEIYWIKYYTDIGYTLKNSNSGGVDYHNNHGAKISDETKTKISQTLKQYYIDNPEKRYEATASMCTKEVQARKRKPNFNGALNPFFGKTHTDETKQLLSTLKKGVKTWNSLNISHNGHIYLSLTDAEKATGINRKLISKYAKNNTHGFKIHT